MVTGISADKFVELFPALYHMAESNLKFPGRKDKNLNRFK